MTSGPPIHDREQAIKTVASLPRLGLTSSEAERIVDALGIGQSDQAATLLADAVQKFLGAASYDNPDCWTEGTFDRERVRPVVEALVRFRAALPVPSQPNPEVEAVDEWFDRIVARLEWRIEYSLDPRTQELMRDDIKALRLWRERAERAEERLRAVTEAAQEPDLTEDEREMLRDAFDEAAREENLVVLERAARKLGLYEPEAPTKPAP